MKNRNLDNHDNWATPKYFYEALNKEFHFDFDPCPLSLEPISTDKDGLLIAWGNRNFINPPYSRKLKEAFIMRAIKEAKEGKLCVLLIPVSTATAIFQNHIATNANEIRFVKGRINFIGVNTKGELSINNAGMHDSMVVVFDGRKQFKGCVMTTFEVPKENKNVLSQLSLFEVS